MNISTTCSASSMKTMLPISRSARQRAGCCMMTSERRRTCVVTARTPAPQRQGVGPFVFFDHFGPITTLPEHNHDVRPHPHIGLATVTSLFEGAMLHRDTLGSVQRIEPGAINWMTAGRGVVHSERRPPDLRNAAHVVHGLQLWVALPKAHEESAPGFNHTPAGALPTVSQSGAQIRVLIGRAFGERFPVETFAPTLYVDIALS